jgi:rare lipoprotein A
MLAIVVLLALTLIPVPVAQGEASYYSNKECSGITASGEQFDDTQMTFAMRTGKFNDKYLVVSKTGMVIVRLNDRGPYAKGRVADLSKTAMARIKGDGLVDVTIFRLPKFGD